MSLPFQQIQPNGQPQPNGPRTVLGAKVVEFALVTYMDESNQQQTQLAIVGDNHVHLIESRGLGISKSTTPQGVASDWLVKGVFEKLGRTVLKAIAEKKG